MSFEKRETTTEISQTRHELRRSSLKFMGYALSVFLITAVTLSGGTVAVGMVAITIACMFQGIAESLETKRLIRVLAEEESP